MPSETFPIIGPQLQSHTHGLAGSVSAVVIGSLLALVWRNRARASDPERNERGLEYSLRPLALYLPALPAGACWSLVLLALSTIGLTVLTGFATLGVPWVD